MELNFEPVTLNHTNVDRLQNLDVTILGPQSSKENTTKNLPFNPANLALYNKLNSGDGYSDDDFEAADSDKEREKRREMANDFKQRLDSDQKLLLE